MSDWSLSALLSGLHDDIHQRLATSRQTFAHSVTKGDASENVWLQLLKKYLPQRYQAESAHVVDSQGNFSQQIDVVVFDRQYSPFIFDYEGQKVIPAESVYGVFEAKQTINSERVTYAQTKVESVRKLHRTSLPVPHVGGVYPPKPLVPIIGGILAFESDWTPPLGDSLLTALNKATLESRLDIGCVAAHGTISYSGENSSYNLVIQSKPATAFLFELIARLQNCATVPMIDITAYASWLAHAG